MKVPSPCRLYLPKFLHFSHPVLTFLTSSVPEILWKIGVAEEDNLLWCILLAYLNSVPDGNTEEFKKRIQRFGPLNYRESIKRWIKGYNPFLHRKASFYDENLRNLVMLFKEKVEEFWERNNVNITISYNDRTLHAASQLLSCRIVVISDIFLQFFSPDVPSEAYDNDILIFYSDFSKSFSFAMSKELGDRKQRAALQTILSKISFTKNKRKEKSVINRICSLPDIKENLLISLLKSDFYYIIPTLLKSPYVIEKILEAGFQIDPIYLDGFQKNALIYAVLLNQSDLLYCVYNFTINYCSMKGVLDTSNRTNFIEEKLKNMLVLQTVLPFLRNEMKLDGKVRAVTESRIRELEYFNNFFFKILSIPGFIVSDITQYMLYGNHKFSNNMSDVESEAVKIRCIIIRILEYHEEFYCWNKTKEKHSEMYFDEFCKHADYFYNLDYFCALKLFDNLFGLKERIKLGKEIFGKIEASFFFYIYCTKYFESMELNEKLLVSQAVSYQKRMKLISDIRQFLKTLKGIELTGDTIIKVLPEDCVHTLTNLPQIYDEFFILRLKHYLNAAMTVNVNDSKFILVIERALQVIGESVKDITLDFISIQKVLSLCLPKYFVQNMKRIRNELSKLKPYHIPPRISLENDRNLFSSIREELKHLEYILKPIFLTQKYKVSQFILSHLLEAVNEAKNFQYSSNNTQTELNAHLTDSSEADDVMDILNFSSEYFSNISQQLKEKIDEGNSNQSNQILTRSMAPKYKYLLENILKNFKNTLNERAYCNIEYSLTSIKEYLYAIDFFLEYIKTDKSVKSRDRQIARDIKCEASLISVTLNNLILKEQNAVDKNQVHKTSEKKLSRRILRNVLPNDMVKKIEGIVLDYENLIENIFNNVIYKKCEENKFISIAKTRQILGGKYFLSEKDKEIILQDVSSCDKDIYETKKILDSCIVGKSSLTRNELEQEISKLNLTGKEKSEFVEECLCDPANALTTLHSVPDSYAQLLSLMEEDDIDYTKCVHVSKHLNLTEASQSILVKLIPGKRQKSLGNQLQYLRDRTKILYNILEEKIEDIKDLWNDTVSRRKKDYIQGKVVEMYLNDPHFQASIEVLLFDCMNILDRRDLKNLWRKTTNLFSGINLRNVLGHGNPLLESLGKLLDPSDLPSELVQRMLLLITDSATMDAILLIVNKTKTDFSGFMKIMNDEDENEFQDLIQQIKDCDLWKDYAWLIPENTLW